MVAARHDRYYTMTVMFDPPRPRVRQQILRSYLVAAPRILRKGDAFAQGHRVGQGI